MKQTARSVVFAGDGDFAHPPIRRVTVDDSGRWLAAGWNDIRRSPAVSLGYGIAFVGFSLLMVYGLLVTGWESLILPLAAGFTIMGPLAAVGLYDISRRHEADKPVGFGTAVSAFGSNLARVGGMGFILLVVLFVWVEAAILLFAFFYNAPPPDLGNLLGRMLFSLDGLPFLLLGSIVGGGLAALVFTISVVSLPMLLDRDVSVITAIATSVAAVRANWQVMVGWAAMIALITALGIATFLVGLAIALPLVGHASWHAYRAMVE